MGGSDAIQFAYDSTSGVVNYQGVTLPEQDPPTQSNPSLNCANVSGSFANSITTVQFSRAIFGGKFPLNETHFVIGAYQVQNSPDFSTYHGEGDHSSISSLISQNFMTGVSSIVARPFGLYDVHALFMFLSWSIILPFGVLFARYGRGFADALWFRVHQPVQFIGVILGCTGFIIAFVMVKLQDGVHFSTPFHAQLGTAIIGLAIVQVAVALLRPHPSKENEKPPKIRRIFEWFHWTVGRILVIAPIAQVISGIQQIGYPYWVLILYCVLLAVVLFSILVFEIFNFVKPRENIVPCTGRKYD